MEVQPLEIKWDSHCDELARGYEMLDSYVLIRPLLSCYGCLSPSEMADAGFGIPRRNSLTQNILAVNYRSLIANSMTIWQDLGTQGTDILAVITKEPSREVHTAKTPLLAFPGWSVISFVEYNPCNNEVFFTVNYSFYIDSNMLSQSNLSFESERDVQGLVQLLTKSNHGQPRIEVPSKAWNLIKLRFNTIPIW